jgi:hypothetical protein
MTSSQTSSWPWLKPCSIRRRTLQIRNPAACHSCSRLVSRVGCRWVRSLSGTYGRATEGASGESPIRPSVGLGVLPASPDPADRFASGEESGGRPQPLPASPGCSSYDPGTAGRLGVTAGRRIHGGTLLDALPGNRVDRAGRSPYVARGVRAMKAGSLAGASSLTDE